MLSTSSRFRQAIARALFIGSVATWSLGARAAPALKLTAKDLGGAVRSIPAQNQKATVLIFVAHDCPISNTYAPEISRIAAEYGKKGVQLMVVYAESELTAALAKQHAAQFGYKSPLLLDANHKISGTLGATVTPEAVVLSPTGQRLYLGRIDNRYGGYGKARSIPTVRDLRLALDAVLVGKPVAVPITTAIGCFIPEATK